MRSTLLSLALLGCTTPPASLPTEQSAPPPFTVTVSDLVAGEDATVSVSTLGRNESAILFLSVQGEGSGPCAPSGSPCLEILSPINLGAMSDDDSDGTAELTFAVPATAADGMEVVFQAVVDAPPGFITADPVTATVEATSTTVETCALDAVDDTATPDTVREVWFLEDSAVSFFGLTLGGSEDGGEQDATDGVLVPVDVDCRLDVYATTSSDTTDVTASTTMDDTTETFDFGVIHTVDNDGDAEAYVQVDVYLADTDQCVTYDLTMLYTCNDVPEVAVALDVDGEDLCGTWTCTPTVTDDDDDSWDLTYAWTVDGVDVGNDTATLDGTTLTEGAVVACSVTATDAYGDAGTGSVEQTTGASTTTVAAAITSPGRLGDTLTCEATATVCDVAESVSYSWTVDGVDAGVTDGELDTSGYAVGAEIACVATASDGSSVTSDSQVLEPDTFTLVGDAGRVGFSVAVMPDLDGDGYATVVAGAPTYSEDTNYGGRVYFVDGALDSDSVDAASVEDGTYGRVFDGLIGNYDLESNACGDNFYVDGCPRDVELTEMDGYDSGPDGSGFGTAVRYGGDVDGDGLPDLLVSAPFEQVSQIWQGRTYVISGATLEGTTTGDLSDATSLSGYVIDGECGRRRDLDDLDDSIVQSAADGDLAGVSISGVGDFNGDGLSDLILGSHNAGDEDRGMVYVLHGRDDGTNVDLEEVYRLGCEGEQETGTAGLDADAGLAFRGEAEPGLGAGSQWGWKVGPGGDFNGDGYDDAVFGGAYQNGIQVLLGRPETGALEYESGTLDPEDGWSYSSGFDFTQDADGNTEFSGIILWSTNAGSGGDFNGDGLDDIVLPHGDTDLNSPFTVVFGNTEPDAIDIPDAQDGFDGVAVVGGGPGYSTGWGAVGRILGDLNGDGYDEAAFGGWNQDVVLVLYGRADGVGQVAYSELEDGSAGFLVYGDEDGNFGWDLVGGDGLADLVVGAPGDDDSDAGYVEVIFGRDLTGDITQYGGASDDTLTGTASVDRLVGGRGDDLLVGNGGADVLYGGSGDDIFEISDLDFLRIRGGDGADTLRLTSSAGDLDLGEPDAKLSGIEAIELNGQTLSLPILDVLGLSELSNQLDLTGSGTVATVAGDNWVQEDSVTEDGITYVVLTNGRATLLIDPALDTEIPPSVTTDTITTDENAAVDAVIGTIEATDPDGDSSALDYQITGGADSATFALDASTGELSVVDSSALDFENQDTFALEVTVTDEVGLATTLDVTVSLDDVNEAPEFTVDALTFGTEEGSGGDGTVLATLGATDQDAGDTFTYSLSGDDAYLFDVDADTGEITLATSETLDAETASEHTFDAVVTDAAGLTSAITVTVEVYDVDVIESSVTLSMSTTGRSLFYDGGDDWEEDWGFDPLDICIQYPDGSFDFSLSTMPGGLLAFADFFDIPDASADFRIAGEFCVTLGASGSNASINASLPVDVNLSFPDEVVPGSTFTVSTDWAIDYTQGSVWGKQPSLDFDFYAGWEDFEISAAFCVPEIDSSGNYTGDNCDTIVDFGPATSSLTLDYELSLDDWVADITNETGTTWGLSSVSYDIIEDSFADADFVDLVLLDWGIPLSDTGSITLTTEMFDDVVTTDINYTVLGMYWEPYFEQYIDPTFQLNGINAVITYEDGSSETFTLGDEAATLTLPDADEDGDGDVDVTIELVPDASVATWWYTNTVMDYRMEMILGDATNTSEEQGFINDMSFGPIYDGSCTDYLDDCANFDLLRLAEADVTGWSVPVIQGAIDIGEAN